MSDADTGKELPTLVQHQFPGSTVIEQDGQYLCLTIHSVGKSPREAMENALSSFREMKDDGRSLPQMLDDVREDLRNTPGMSRARHDSLQEILTICEQALNGGVLTQTVPWIMVPSYTRQIEDLRRKVETRLLMVAQEMKDKEKARNRAAMRFPRPTPPDEGGQTAYERLFSR